MRARTGSRLKREILRIATLGGLILGLFVTVVLLNQTIQLCTFFYQVHPWLGHGSVAAFVLLYSLAFVLPLFLLLRLPEPLRPPQTDDPEAQELYLRRLSHRLRRNPHLSGFEGDLATRTGVEAALMRLDTDANTIIKDSAATVFVSTAVSQNGRLDAVLVLLSQLRLVWRIAHLYRERPNLRELMGLYNNVFVAALLANQLEDLDINERIEPIVRSAIGGGLAGMVPGATAMTTVLLSSIMEGTANAYLTLRVGIVARRYCSARHPLQRRKVGKLAAVEAGALLGDLVMQSTRVVSMSVARALGKAGTSTVTSFHKNLADSATAIFEAAQKGANSFFRTGGYETAGPVRDPEHPRSGSGHPE